MNCFAKYDAVIENMKNKLEANGVEINVKAQTMMDNAWYTYAKANSTVEEAGLMEYVLQREPSGIVGMQYGGSVDDVGRMKMLKIESGDGYVKLYGIVDGENRQYTFGNG